MEDILKDLSFARVYLDDVVIFSKSVEDHMRYVSAVFDRIASHSLRLLMSKWVFCQDKLHLLGHVVTPSGI